MAYSQSIPCKFEILAAIPTTSYRGCKMLLHVSCSKNQNFAELHQTFKAIHKIAPDYISNLISLKGSTRYSFRSSNTMLLSVPSGKSLKTLGDRAFGVKKIPVVPVPDRPYFFLLTLLFFQHDLTVQPYFLRVVAGCCQNGVCCHTNY